MRVAIAVALVLVAFTPSAAAATTGAADEGAAERTERSFRPANTTVSHDSCADHPACNPSSTADEPSPESTTTWVSHDSCADHPACDPGPTISPELASLGIALGVGAVVGLVLVARRKR